MKKHVGFFLVISIVLVFLQVTSCKKIEQIFPVPPQADLKFCNVSNMTVKYPMVRDSIIYNFKYDSYGKPLSRISLRPGLATANVYFTYDKYERLTNVIAPLGVIDPKNIQGTFYFDFWIKYTYNDQSKKLQPVADTVYTLGGFINGNICCTTPITENYEYDTVGRVSKITSRLPGLRDNIVEYKYDARGNLITGRIYDNKVNIRRTNAVWMLLDLDYSRNNPFTAEAYNRYGLPKKTGSISSLLISRSPVFNISDATINYMCDSE